MAMMENNLFFGNCTHESSNPGMKIQDTRTKWLWSMVTFETLSIITFENDT